MIDEASSACILSLMYLFINIVVAAHQLSVAFLSDDIPTAREKRKHKRALAPYKRNVSAQYGLPTTNLIPKIRLEDILQDSEGNT
jgi:hypothetical protein